MQHSRDVVVDAAFPGGNVVVDSIDGARIRVHQDVRDTEGDWFYWSFRVRGAAGRTLEVEFTGSQVIANSGPAASFDGGATWQWLGLERVTDLRSFACDVPPGCDDARFSVAIPYVESNLRAWLDTHAGEAHLREETLCRTRTGRAVEMLRLGRLDGAPAHRIALAARHHCCEMIADFVLEGLMDAILADDDTGAWYRANVEALVVPFADKDGVEDGDQGKQRRPRDHGRDYLGESLYAEPRALREFLPRWSAGRLRFVADVHCPWIRGRHNEEIYQVGASDPAHAAAQGRFGPILERVRRGELPYRTADDLPFGVDWNTGANYATGASFARWAREIPEVALATSLEVPYGLVHGTLVTPERARAFGRDLAEAIREYLTSMPPAAGPGHAGRSDMNTHREPQRDIPVVGEYDVIVVGGGPAGVGAALAAARSGMKTLVVEQFNCLGGVATAGGHGHISRYDENGTNRLIVGGVALEIAKAVETEHVGRRSNYGIWFEVEGLKSILDRKAQGAKIDVLYYTFFCETIVKHGAAAGVVIQSKDGRRAVHAKRVIDCTGDGDVAASAGCAFEVGRPRDQKCQPVTLMFTIGGVDWDRVQEFQKQYRAENPDDKNPWKLERVYSKAQKNGDMEPYQAGNMGWWWTPTRPDWVGVNFTHIIHIDTTKAADLTKATMEGRRQAYLTIDVYRKYIPGMEKCYMVSTPNTVGLRESRRITGEYILNEDEIRGQKEFDDGICYGSFFVDIHNIDGPGMSPTCWHPPKGFKYQIPYRSLVPLKVDNLLTAGRCVSCTHVALGSIRVMVPCIAMGEAAGIAAAQSIGDGVAPRAIDVQKLRTTLRERGGILGEDDIVRANAAG